MKAALSIVLAALLIMLPVEQVLAQAVQQEAVSVQQTAPSDGAAALFRVPPVTENPARLLRTNPADALLPTPNLGLAVAINPRVDEPAPMPLSRGGKIAIIVGAVLVIGAVVILYSIANFSS
jgi:hypothetical protein